MPRIEDFHDLEIRAGTVLAARNNEKAHRPAYVLEIDFGKLGVRTSSAQITDNYKPVELVGRQVVAVTNLPPKRVAGVKSQVLVLGAIGDAQDVVLLRPDRKVADGQRVI